MTTTTTSTTAPAIPLAVSGTRYPQHFGDKDYKFRWIQGTGLDKELPPRANHLAARLNDLFIGRYSAAGSVEQLVELTGMSPSTVARAIGDLVRRGWLAPRTRGSDALVLLMPDHGVDLLLEHRDRVDGFHGRKAVNDEWTAVTFARINEALGTTFGTHNGTTPPHLRKRIRSIVSHMVDPNTEVPQLIGSLTEQPPIELRDPVGFLLHRAAEHVRARPHLSHRQPARSTTSSGTRTGTVADTVDIGSILGKLVDQLTNPDRAGCRTAP